MGYDFEAWELDYEFIEREDWRGLVRYRQRVANQNPDSYYDLWRLGDAYIRNGEYQKAIDYLGKLHCRFPNGLDIHYSLLDALYASGKTENDFNWVVRPEIAYLDQGSVDNCYEYLRHKRKPRALYELYALVDGYKTYSEADLLTALANDGRFELEGTSSFTDISVRRKKSNVSNI